MDGAALERPLVTNQGLCVYLPRAIGIDSFQWLIRPSVKPDAFVVTEESPEAKFLTPPSHFSRWNRESRAAAAAIFV
jgi:hypothetical protein